MNIYSDSQFCCAFGDAYFPNENIGLGVFHLNNFFWRIPALDGNNAQIIVDRFENSFIDYFEPYYGELKTNQISGNLKYLPRVSYGIVTATDWFDKELSRNFTPAPTVFWENFQKWEEFLDHIDQVSPRLQSDSNRCRRKIERELGSLIFTFEDQDPLAILNCILWKANQCYRTGMRNIYCDTQHLSFLKQMFDRKLIFPSSLRVEGKLIAVDLLIFKDGCLYDAVGAYDPNYSQYSPGRLLQVMILQESFNRKHREFNLLLSGPKYKWNYATHTRLISDIGIPSIKKRVSKLQTSAKQSLQSCIDTSGFLQLLLKDLREIYKQANKKTQQLPSMEIIESVFQSVNKS